MPSLSLLSALLPLVPLAHAYTGQELFTVSCAPLTIQRADPIVEPGKVSGHVHIVVGGSNFKQTESNEDAINSKGTTCNRKLDNSNYWIPQLYHETSAGFEIVKMTGAAIYYENRACDYEPGKTECDRTKLPRAPPKGLRMVAGNPFRRTFDSSDSAQKAIQHMCLVKEGETEPDITNGFPIRDCEQIRSQLYFPSCWDGKNVDSTDHKTHVSYPSGAQYDNGMCPESHPIAMYSVFFEFFYDTRGIEDPKSFVYAMGDRSGYGLHGDYIQAWTDQDKLERAMATCTGPNGPNDAACSLFGTGQAEVLAPETPAPAEEVGLNGPLSQLPGNNPLDPKKAQRSMRFMRDM